MIRVMMMLRRGSAEGAVAVGLALLLAACTSGGNPSSSPPTTARAIPATAQPTAPPVASSRPQAPLSARIVLPSNTMTAGSSISGQVIVDNNTGRAIHGGDCGSPFAVALGSDTVKPSVAWPQCLESFTVPTGQSSWPVTVTARYSECGGGIRRCTNGRPPSLPPGYYRAMLFQSPHLVPSPTPITVHVMP